MPELPVAGIPYWLEPAAECLRMKRDIATFCNSFQSSADAATPSQSGKEKKKKQHKIKLVCDVSRERRTNITPNTFEILYALTITDKSNGGKGKVVNEEKVKW